GRGGYAVARRRRRGGGLRHDAQLPAGADDAKLGVRQSLWHSPVCLDAVEGPPLRPGPRLRAQRRCPGMDRRLPILLFDLRRRDLAGPPLRRPRTLAPATVQGPKSKVEGHWTLDVGLWTSGRSPGCLDRLSASRPYP